MPDMKELLERLKVADPVAFEEIFTNGYYGLPMEIMTVDVITPNYPERWNDLIQGCIQRAIAARGWGVCQGFDIPEKQFDILPHAYKPYAYIGKLEAPGPFLGARTWAEKSCGDSPAMALLAAYLAVVEGMG